jgi:hypothetical protein
VQIPAIAILVEANGAGTSAIVHHVRQPEGDGQPLEAYVIVRDQQVFTFGNRAGSVKGFYRPE